LDVTDFKGIRAGWYFREGQAWRVGALLMWLWKLLWQNGPNFTWPLLAFSSILPEWLMAKMGKMYRGKPLLIKTRRELLATVKPQHRKYLRKDNGDLPDAWGSLVQEEPTTQLPVLSKIDSN
jgi:hypothetical protein